MAIAILKTSRAPIHLWAPVEEVEAQALDQLRNIASLPWVFHHVAAMPDVHLGKGATVGSVIAMKGAVSPAAVGVDIGCGMGAIRTSLTASDLPDNLRALRSDVEATIPVGFNAHERVQFEDRALFSDFANLHESVQRREDRARLQVGTLGGGNHFIELCLDEAQGVWMMLHSGSRNIGKELAEHHIAVARTLAHNARLPDPDLAVFLANTPEMAAYRHDLLWAQRYAMLNRRVMFDLYATVMRRHFPPVRFEPPILCHHNYVSEETHFGEDVIVTRKGAISARKGELGIIPGSMGTASYIVRGVGSSESFTSASHGAGRRMSRHAARRRYTTRDLAQQTAGVECRKDAGVVDEIPGAYKDIDQVMAHQSDLVEVVAKLRQVLCVKG
jgi:tRNA-splicing ligase RtcB (3'-phosphate/5'-hydroxy nucleic acid ligase)